MTVELLAAIAVLALAGACVSLSWLLARLSAASMAWAEHVQMESLLQARRAREESRPVDPFDDRVAPRSAPSWSPAPPDVFAPAEKAS
jgi:type II secretory pathway pseudopilin PulG